MKSFVKISQLSTIIGGLAGAPIMSRGATDWINEILNPEAITKHAVFLVALFQNLSYRYDPSAFYHVEELDRSRGYEATDPKDRTKAIIDPATNQPMTENNSDKPYTFQHSMGHLEYMDYKDLQNKINRIPSGPHGVTTEHQFSELKPEKDMPLFVKKNINIGENSPEYAEMFKKLYPGVTKPAPVAEAKKFQKLAQSENVPVEKKDYKAQELGKLIPRWDIKTVIDDLNKIAQIGQSQGLSQDQIKVQIENKFKKYKDEIAPLKEYLIKNGYGQKTN